MEFKKLMSTALMLGAMTFGATTASAQFSYIAQVNTALGSSFNTTSDCIVCHSAADNSGGDKGVTPFATDWKSLASASTGKLTTADQVTLAGKDSDGDGDANSVEAAAGTSFWGTVASGGTSSSESGGGCISASATTPLMMFLALLSLGFFVRRKKD